LRVDINRKRASLGLGHQGDLAWNPIHSVTFSPDGKYLAAVVSRGVKMWQTGTCEEDRSCHSVYMNESCSKIILSDGRRIIDHGHRPWYEEGPPRGPLGSNEPTTPCIARDRRHPGCQPHELTEKHRRSLEALRDTPRRPSLCQADVVVRRKARRIARSSSGRTARGRGFRKY
jgi:hypothetical protein